MPLRTLTAPSAVTPSAVEVHANGGVQQTSVHHQQLTFVSKTFLDPVWLLAMHQFTKTNSLRHARPVATFGGGAVIETLGGLIGLGGAEFRLPLLIGAFRFAALEAVLRNPGNGGCDAHGVLPVRAFQRVHLCNACTREYVREVQLTAQRSCKSDGGRNMSASAGGG